MDESGLTTVVYRLESRELSAQLRCMGCHKTTTTEATTATTEATTAKEITTTTTTTIATTKMTTAIATTAATSTTSTTASTTADTTTTSTATTTTEGRELIQIPCSFNLTGGAGEISFPVAGVPCSRQPPPIWTIRRGSKICPNQRRHSRPSLPAIFCYN